MATSLKIENPHFKSAVELAALALAKKVDDFLLINAQVVGKVATIGEIRAGLSVDDAAALSRPVFNQVCFLNGYKITNPEDISA